MIDPASEVQLEAAGAAPRTYCGAGNEFEFDGDQCWSEPG